MRKFNEFERNLISFLNKSNEEGNFISNYLDNLVPGCIITCHANNKKVELNFTKSDYFDKYIITKYQYIILSTVNLVEYLLDNRLVMKYIPAHEGLTEFSIGSTFIQMDITYKIPDENIASSFVELLKYKIVTSEYLKQLEDRKFVDENDYKFNMQLNVTWAGIIVAAALALFSIHLQLESNKGNDVQVSKIVNDLKEQKNEPAATFPKQTLIAKLQDKVDIIESEKPITKSFQEVSLEEALKTEMLVNQALINILVAKGLMSQEELLTEIKELGRAR